MLYTKYIYYFAVKKASDIHFMLLFTIIFTALVCLVGRIFNIIIKFKTLRVFTVITALIIILMVIYFDDILTYIVKTLRMHLE